MTSREANIDKHFERAPKDHILRTIDRMRRTNPHSASSLDWFPVSKSDAGLEADYFNRDSDCFYVEKRRDNAPAVAP